MVEREVPRGEGPLGREGGPDGRLRITALDERQHGLRAGVLPARIADGREVVVAPDADLAQDLPGPLEQGVMRVRGRQRGRLRRPARRSPPSLGEEPVGVGRSPTKAACPLSGGVGFPPGPEVIGRPLAEPALRLPDLVAPALAVAGPIAGLALAGSAPRRVGIVAATCPGLVDAEGETIREGPTAGRAGFGRHDLRRAAAAADRHAHAGGRATTPRWFRGTGPGGRRRSPYERESRGLRTTRTGGGTRGFWSAPLGDGATGSQGPCRRTTTQRVHAIADPGADAHRCERQDVPARHRPGAVGSRPRRRPGTGAARRVRCGRD